MSGENKMSNQPIGRLMIKMGIPMILSMVVQALYNIVDSYFVSGIVDVAIPNLGEYAVNALTLAFPVQTLMIAIGVGTGIGVNSLLSRSLGAGEREKASRVAGNAVGIGLVTYLVFLLFGLLGTRTVLAWQTDDPLVLELGSQYLGICCVWSFGSILFMIYEKLLQGTGRTVLCTIAQTAGAVTNIVLDPILIYGLLGCPAMGVRGAAIATVIGQMVSLVLGMVFHYGMNRDVDGHPRYMLPNRQVIGEVFKIGAPAVLLQSLMPVMSFGINVIYGLVSAATVTAFGIYYKIQQFVLFAAFGMNNAIIPIVAFNYGMRSRERVDTAIRFGLLYTLAIMLLGLLVLQLFAAQLCNLFSLTAETQALCIRAIRIVTLGYLFVGANVAFQGIFQALGCGVRSLLLSLVRQIVVVLPLAWALTFLPDAQNWVWLAFPVAEACGLVLALLLMRGVAREKIIPLDAAPETRPQ